MKTWLVLKSDVNFFREAMSTFQEVPSQYKNATSEGVPRLRGRLMLFILGDPHNRPSLVYKGL